MLTAQGISVAYGAMRAVDGVDLRIPDGCVLSLLGPSGCGKSTLLRAVAGLEPLQAGRIDWDGTDLASVAVHRRGFGLMFQDGVLFPHRTVAGNVAYGLHRLPAGDFSATPPGGGGPSKAGGGFPGRFGRHRRNRAAIAARVTELLNLVGLGGLGDREVATLSGGQAQRVALARALGPEPRLLLLDEPLAALDRSLRDRLVVDLRRVLAETGTTALYVTHDQDEAFAVAGAVALMDAGRIRQIGPPGQVWRRPADEWVARFVGYETVFDTAALLAAGVPLGDTAGFSAGSRVAVRPAGFVLDPAGTVRADCLGVLPGPDGLRLTVQIQAIGRQMGGRSVAAVAALGSSVMVGDQIRLRFVPAAAASLAS